MKRVTTLAEAIFFGNYFYGICAVALSIEASLQQGYPLNGFFYYATVFACTVLYYTKAYITEKVRHDANPRSIWYAKFNHIIIRTQVFLTLFVVVVMGIFVPTHWKNIMGMGWKEWGLLISFPLVAALYYGINSQSLGKYNLRSIGWLKPFVIGLAWAGPVTIYPVLYYHVLRNEPLPITLIGFLLFLKNFMYVTLLCILFDIKDYAADHNRQLKTFVVKAGLRKTIFVIVIPLTIIGLGSFLTYGFLHQFSPMKILLNTIPFLLLIAVTYSMQRRKSLFFYLILIDGLMLVKAVCGSVAMLYF